MTNVVKPVLDCGHQKDLDCDGVVIKTPNGSSRNRSVCHYCALEMAREDELYMIVEWLKFQTRYGVPNFVISYLEGRQHREHPWQL